MQVCIHPAYLSSRLPRFGVRASSSHYPSAVAKSAATEFDVVVCGGGAAGLTAAYFAADAGARVRLGAQTTHGQPLDAPDREARHCCLQVLVLEKESQPGKKILISGGTRWCELQACMLASRGRLPCWPPAAAPLCAAVTCCLAPSISRTTTSRSPARRPCGQSFPAGSWRTLGSGASPPLELAIGAPLRTPWRCSL